MTIITLIKEDSEDLENKDRENKEVIKMINTKEITLADIMKCLKEQKEDILDAKTETNARLEKFMNVIETNVGEVRKDVNILNNIMEERERDRIEIQKKNEERFQTSEKRREEERADLEKRMKKLEEALKITKLDKKKENRKEKEDTVTVQPEGRAGTMDNPRNRECTSPSSEWRKSVCSELKEAAELADKQEKAKKESK